MFISRQVSKGKIVEYATLGRDAREVVLAMVVRSADLGNGANQPAQLRVEPVLHGNVLKPGQI
jgi:hypothetical protein